jgi:4-amino-4-deoxy-L-arabinose transferase-like glycosyltransferase
LTLGGLRVRTPALLDPLRDRAGRLDPVLLVLFALVNGLVLWNALHHHPPAGYDANAHIRYALTLAEGRLPTRRDTYEFFSPPLSYAAPALAVATGLVDGDTAPRLAQVLNVVYSVGTTILLLRIAEGMSPGGVALKRTALLLLGMLPVYYKTFAFVRPEPMLTFLSLAVLLVATRVFDGREHRVRDGVGLGVLMGLSLLARQQAVFVIAAVAVFALLAAGSLAARGPLRSLAAALVVAFLVGGWFYVAQARDTGGVLAFSPGLQTGRDAAFFRGTGEGVLFRDPVRPAFRNQLGPVLYSETWGDHGCYFLVYGSQEGRPVWGTYLEEALTKRPRWLRTNRWSMGRYLGRVNLVSLVPTGVFLLGLGAGVASLRARARTRANDPRADALALLTLTVLATVAGYVVLLAFLYANPTGSLIKATYVLPAFPPAALLAAAILERLGALKPRLHKALLGLLVLVALHDAPAFVTRYRLDGRGKMVPAAGEVGAREGPDDVPESQP